jgi:hypothetical protein
MSTATILSKADTALKNSFYPALRLLSVERSEETLIISGKVTTYYLKQLAQEAIMPVRGPMRLENRVAVIGAR